MATKNKDCDEKNAIVKFIGDPQDYISGKECDEWVYCRDCLDKKECKREKHFLFVYGREYKAYF